MSKKEDTYSTSLTLSRSNPVDLEAISKMQNRDRTKYHSIPEYVKAAVLAFDDKNEKIDYSVSAKRDLINELKAEMNQQSESLKKYFMDELITKFGL